MFLFSGVTTKRSFYKSLQKKKMINYRKTKDIFTVADLGFLIQSYPKP